MISYAATINVRHISTSKKARSGLLIGAAKKAALDNLTYICRADAVADFDIIGHCQGVTLIAESDIDRAALREMSRWAISARAKRHTETNGIRLADKLIVSLPWDATPEHHREMVSKIVSELGGDSEAWLVAAIHRDRKGNPHAHILAIDGLETRGAAAARRPDAKRVRQQDALRLNEGGNRQTLRNRIAAKINDVSSLHGYRWAEVRSLEDQGIGRAPQSHDGPYGSARRTLRDTFAWLERGLQNDTVEWDIFSPIKPLIRSRSALFANKKFAQHEACEADEVRNSGAR